MCVSFFDQLVGFFAFFLSHVFLSFKINQLLQIKQVLTSIVRKTCTALSIYALSYINCLA